MNRARPRSARAYSLVEMIVVVSIIAILLSLAGIGVMGWINSSKNTGTQGTLKTLKAAIDVFVNERPIQDRPIASPPPPNPTIYYFPWFNNLPPCPVMPWSSVPPWNPAEPVGDRPYLEVDPQTSQQFNYLIGRYLQVSARRWPVPGGYKLNTPPDPEKDYASIECLVLFLSQCSPRSKALIDKLPSESKPNQDKDEALLPGNNNNNWVPLIEITDAWDHPLRWAIWPHDQTKTANQGLPVRWELRSAGKDGEFAAAFTPKDQSDDVILQGP